MHFVLLAALCGPLASADEGLDALLESIPEIQNQASEVEEEKPTGDPEGGFPVYVRKVRLEVLNAWKPKEKTLQKDLDLKAQFMVNIADTGKVTDIRTVALSGNKKFDQAALDAIVAAGDFDIPHPAYQEEAARGVVIEFSSRLYLYKQQKGVWHGLE